MSKWENKTIGDFLSLQRGHDLTSEERGEGTIPVIGAAGKNGFHSKALAKAPGVIVGRSGGSFGQVHFTKEDFWPHNTAMYVTDFKGNDPYFTYYFLKNLDFDRLNSGSAQPSLNRNFIYPIKVSFPKPEEQSKIASVLSSIDQKIEINNRINAELEAMAKTLYDYWFVQFDFPFDFAQGKPDENGKPYKSSGGNMVYSKELKREIPVGWDVKSLWDIAKYYNGLAMQKHRPKGEKFLPVIKIKEMGDGYSEATEKASPDIPKTAIIEDGDVLFSWSATLDVKIWSGGKGALNQHIFKVVSSVYPKSFFYYEIINYLNHFKMMADKRKTTMGHITLDHLKQSRIVLPPLELIQCLDKKITPVFDQHLILEKENQQLAALRDWLLPMLMNGQVQVTATQNT